MNDPPNSRYFACGRSGHPIVWITRSSGRGTFHTSFTPSSHTWGAASPRSPKRSSATLVRCPFVPSASTVTRATRSLPGSKLASSSCCRPRPLSPVRTPTTPPCSTRRSTAEVSGRNIAPSASARSASQRPSCERETTTLPWLRIGGGVGIGRPRSRVRTYTCSLSTAPYVGMPSRPPWPSNSRSSAPGRITAPDRRCDPACLPFSTTASGTSPSRSATSGCSSSSCPKRIAQARPAGPAPTTSTPTSMRSSTGSLGATTNRSASSAVPKSAGRDISPRACGAARPARGRRCARQPRPRGR